MLNINFYFNVKYLYYNINKIIIIKKFLYNKVVYIKLLNRAKLNRVVY